MSHFFFPYWASVTHILDFFFHRSMELCFFFSFYLFSLCSSCWIIPAELSSCSLTLSSAISNFLLGPSDEISFHFCCYFSSRISSHSFYFFTEILHLFVIMSRLFSKSLNIFIIAALKSLSTCYNTCIISG